MLASKQTKLILSERCLLKDCPMSLLAFTRNTSLFLRLREHIANYSPHTVSWRQASTHLSYQRRRRPYELSCHLCLKCDTGTKWVLVLVQQDVSHTQRLREFIHRIRCLRPLHNDNEYVPIFNLLGCLLSTTWYWRRACSDLRYRLGRTYMGFPAFHH